MASRERVTHEGRVGVGFHQADRARVRRARLALLLAAGAIRAVRARVEETCGTDEVTP